MKLPDPILLATALACLALAFCAEAQATILFQDDFNASNGTPLSDRATRATGTLASTVKYAWTSTTDVAMDGTLNWDSDNTRNGQHQQTETGAGTTARNFRIIYNWAPQLFREAM